MRNFLSLAFILVLSVLFSSYTSKPVDKLKRVSFYVSGTGSKGITVKLGVGSQIGSGSCCYSISPVTSMVSYSAEEGHVLYDSERNRIIVKITASMEGTTINLKDYY
jgi:hypothetical protein